MNGTDAMTMYEQDCEDILRQLTYHFPEVARELTLCETEYVVGASYRHEAIHPDTFRLEP